MCTTTTTARYVLPRHLPAELLQVAPRYEHARWELEGALIPHYIFMDQARDRAGAQWHSQFKKKKHTTEPSQLKDDPLLHRLKDKASNRTRWNVSGQMGFLPIVM